MSRGTLRRGLIGCWVVSILLLGLYVVAWTVVDGERIGVPGMFILFPVYFAAVWPFCADAWRNPRLSDVAAAVWIWAILNLPFAFATAYWYRHPVSD